MRRSAISALFLLFATHLAFPQDHPGPKFEIASVKPAGPQHDPPYVYRDGPGTADPERVTYERIGLLNLLRRAYSPATGYDAVHMLDWDQISGPAWLGTQFYSVDAKLPAGTSKEQLRLMWRDLLAERFHLKVHLTTKEFSVYELTVARNGPKFKKASDGPYKPPPGFPIPASGEKRALAVVPPRNTRQTFRDSSMAELAEQLAWPLSEASGQVWANSFTLGKIIDTTGLDGRYDFTLEYAGLRIAGGAHPSPLPDGQTETAPNLFDALREQLGLKLEEKRVKLDLLVVDHADKVPTEN